ncbi:MAG: hypothetical protein H6728_14085 [Myxococcales bacterium]|nr:hypothetical protein [Myxococcales bacterium]
MESPPPLSAWGVQVDPELEAIVQHALLKDPAQRFQSCDEFAASLLGYLQKHITSPSGVFLGATSLSPVPSSFSSPAPPSFSAISSNQNSPMAYAQTETRLPTGQHTNLGASAPTIYPDSTGRSNKPLIFALLLLVLLPATGLGLYYSGFFRAPAQSSQTPQKNLGKTPSQTPPLAPTAQGFALQVRPAPKPPEMSQPTAPIPPRTSPAALGQLPKVPPIVEPRTPATPPTPPRSEPRKRKLRSHRRKAPAMSCKRCIKDVFRRHPPTANVFSLHHGCQTKMLQRAAHDCVKACQRTPRRFCRTYGGYLAHQHLRYTYPAKSAEGLWLMATRNILGRCMRRLKQNASLIFSHPYRFPNESTTNQCILAFDKGLRRSLYRWKQKQQAKTKSPLSPPETWKQFKNKMKQSADKFKKDAEKFKRGLGFDD